MGRFDVRSQPSLVSPRSLRIVLAQKPLKLLRTVCAEIACPAESSRL